MNLNNILSQWWGFESLRPLQEEAINSAINGRDSVVVMPTGGGKSLCYQLPPLIGNTTDVVISPLVALMKDQVDSLETIGYPAAALYAGMTQQHRRQIKDRLIAGDLRLLFTAPERLVNTGLLDLLAESGVKRFSIDEAHCISHWGHDFRPEYRQLAMLRDRFPQASFHAFTATATPKVQTDIVEQLHLRNPEVLVGTFDRPNLTYRVLPRTSKLKQALEILGRHHGEASIVYCLSRRETEDLAAKLSHAGILAQPYHAGLDAAERHATQEAFSQEKIDVVVATVAFGMGIDRSNVRLVLHTSLPKSLEAYQQETGRAGRDGLAAECVLLYSSADVFSWESLIRRSFAETEMTKDQVHELLDATIQHLHAIRRYAQGACCRHATLSEYFGQPYGNTNCSACDICLDETENLPNSTTIAQKIISCVARVEQRFGVRHICEVLRGAQTTGIIRHNHDQLSTYGLLSELDQRTTENLMHQLLDQELVQRSSGDRPVITLNTKSWEVLRGEREVILLQPSSIKTKAFKKAADDWQGVDRELFERLRVWRRKIALSRNKPAWTIFDDKSLRSIAREKPTNPAELLKCKGIGEKRLADFGVVILDIVNTKDSP